MAIFVDISNRDGWAHLVSSLHGESGRRELADFAAEIGLIRILHRHGTYAEHYDIRGKEVDRALKAGARVVSRRELAQILRRKKVENPVKSGGLDSS